MVTARAAGVAASRGLEAGAPPPGAGRARALLSAQSLAIGYGSRCVARGISCDLAAGSLTAVVGGNGSGKSTLLKTLLGHLRPLEGQVRRAVPVRDTAYLPQLGEVERAAPMTVCDFVSLGTWAETSWWRSLRGGAALARTLEAIAAVGLTGLEGQWIGDLSGGQFQRVRFARLMVQAAPLVLLDEPFSGVDEQTTADLLCLIGQWQQEGAAVIAVLHDLGLVRRHFPHTLALSAAGGAPACGPTAEVLRRHRPCAAAAAARGAPPEARP